MPTRFKNAVALVFSIVFYAWGAPKFVFILLASTFLDFYLVRCMHRQKTQREKRVWLTLSILLNVGLLAYFKYANFFVENVNALLVELGYTSIAWVAVALPIGISFYTFQTLTYSIDIYRGVDKPLEKASDYILYIMLFPQMIAGPIVRFSSIASQIRNRVVTSNHVIDGFYRFAIGLSKKVFLANTMGEIADNLLKQSITDLSSAQSWLAIIAYAFQIYFDFSGYSDMAIGLGRMMGFKFPENFNNPYISKSITEFWRRWHITLGTWMRDYLYIPLGGNRNGVLRNYGNLWVVFLISGLWHGASWNFVIWGAYHGLFLVLERLLLFKLWKKLPSFISVLITFFIAVLGWVVFRIEDFGSALLFYQKLFEFNFDLNGIHLDNDQLFFMSLSVFFSFFILIPGAEKTQIKMFANSIGLKQQIVRFITTVVLLFLCICWLTAGGFNPFIYFRF